MKPGVRGLSDEERILWTNVARSALPLKGKVLPPPVSPAPAETGHPHVPAPQATPRPAASRQPAAPRRIDAPVKERIAKGKVPLEGRIDLHGLTQARAHGLLLSFLRRGHAEGRRHVLVITGKGSSLGSEGVLRRAVPDWFATPDFRGLVSGYSDASRHHGGAGALYVRLARNPAPSP